VIAIQLSRLEIALNHVLSSKKSFLTMPFLTALLSMISIGTSASSIPLQQAITAFNDGYYQQAKVILDDELSLTPNSERVNHYLGRTAYLQAELDKAETYFKTAIKLNDQLSDNFYWLAVTYAAQFKDVGFFSASSLADRFLEAAKQAVKLAPDSLLAHEGLLKFYIGAPGIIGGSINKAKKRAKIIANLNTAAGHFALGRIHFYEGDFQLAEVQIRKALAIEPNRMRYVFGLGYLLREMDRHSEAVDVFLKVSQLQAIDPFDRIDLWRAKYETGRASSLSGEKLELGRQALVSYKKRNVSSSNLDGDDWAQARLVSIYQHQGKNKQAKELLSKLLAADPDSKLKKLLKKQLKQQSDNSI